MFDRAIVQERLKKIEKMIGLRNLIIHEYLRLDLGKIHQRGNLEDLTQFAQCITEFLEKSEDPKP